MEVKVLASGSSGNAYQVADGEARILLDAGIPAKRIQAGIGFKTHELAGCLVTHSHQDHCKAVKDLLKFGVDVWMPGKEADAAGIPAHHRLHRLEESEDGAGTYRAFRCGGFTVLPFRTMHDTPEPVGYMVQGPSKEKLPNFTDTYYTPRRLPAPEHLIGERNYDNETVEQVLETGEVQTARLKRLFSTHMSLDNFLAFLRNLDTRNLRKIYICHMSSDRGNEQKIREAVQKQTGAEVYVC